MDEMMLDEDLPTATLTTKMMEAVRSTFIGASLTAAQTIVGIADGSIVELGATGRLRLDAAKYVVEYALGKPKETGATDRIDELTEMFSKNEAGSHESKEEWIAGGVKGPTPPPVGK